MSARSGGGPKNSHLRCDRTDTVLIPLPGRPPDQVAYVVPELEEGVQRLGRRFGVSRWLGWRYTSSYLPHRIFRGQPGDFESQSMQL